jgi:hypothetical protein
VASGTDSGLELTYLLDTNSLIYYFQGAPQMDPVFRQIEQGTARPVVSIITVIELLGYPRLTRQDETRIQTLLSGFTVVAVDERIASQAVVLKRRRGVKTPDAIIAATALLENACPVTRDHPKFEIEPQSTQRFGGYGAESRPSPDSVLSVTSVVSPISVPGRPGPAGQSTGSRVAQPVRPPVARLPHF